MRGNIRIPDSWRVPSPKLYRTMLCIAERNLTSPRKSGARWSFYAFGGSPIFRNGIFIKNRNFNSGLASSPKAVDALIHRRDVSDGLSNTLMVSEKAYNTYYMKEVQFGDRLGYFTGFGITTLRSGSRRPRR